MLPCVPSQSFAREELLPHAAAWDADKHFPVDTLRGAAELGFAGINVRDDVGGCGPCFEFSIATNFNGRQLSTSWSCSPVILETTYLLSLMTTGCALVFTCDDAGRGCAALMLRSSLRRWHTATCPPRRI